MIVGQLLRFNGRLRVLKPIKLHLPDRQTDYPR